MIRHFGHLLLIRFNFELITVCFKQLILYITSNLNRSFEEIYENDDQAVANSTNKPNSKDVDRDVFEVKKNLLNPKNEK